MTETGVQNEQNNATENTAQNNRSNGNYFGFAIAALKSASNDNRSHKAFDVFAMVLNIFAKAYQLAETANTETTSVTTTPRDVSVTVYSSAEAVLTADQNTENHSTENNFVETSKLVSLIDGDNFATAGNFDTLDSDLVLVDELSQETLQAVVEKAAKVLSLISLFDDIEIKIADLDDGVLAELRDGTLYVDVDVAGFVWILNPELIAIHNADVQIVQIIIDLAFVAVEENRLVDDGNGDVAITIVAGDAEFWIRVDQSGLIIVEIKRAVSTLDAGVVNSNGSTSDDNQAGGQLILTTSSDLLLPIWSTETSERADNLDDDQSISVMEGGSSDNLLLAGLELITQIFGAFANSGSGSDAVAIILAPVTSTQKNDDEKLIGDDEMAGNDGGNDDGDKSTSGLPSNTDGDEAAVVTGSSANDDTFSGTGGGEAGSTDSSGEAEMPRAPPVALDMARAPPCF